MASFLASALGRKNAPQVNSQQGGAELVLATRASLDALLTELKVSAEAKVPEGVEPELKVSELSLADTAALPQFTPLSLATEALGARLHQVKLVLYGNTDQPVVDEPKALELARAAPVMVKTLIENMDKLPFESRKDLALIFNNLIRKSGCDFAEWVFENFDPVVTNLVRGYKNPDVALSCGSMLRECIRHENLSRTLLQSELLWLFFDDYAHLPNFEVALDAINTLRDLLLSEKSSAIASKFVEANYSAFFRRYEVLLVSNNYVTRIRSLKMLGEMLLDRINFNVMIKYISSRHNLKIVMNALRDKSPNIQVEAFHVFKIFVANPKKPPEIAAILFKNKEKLVQFLEAFVVNKDDGQFCDERDLLVETLSALEEPPAYSHTSHSNSQSHGRSNASTFSGTAKAVASTAGGGEGAAGGAGGAEDGAGPAAETASTSSAGSTTLSSGM